MGWGVRCAVSVVVATITGVPASICASGASPTVPGNGSCAHVSALDALFGIADVDRLDEVRNRERPVHVSRLVLRRQRQKAERYGRGMCEIRFTGGDGHQDGSATNKDFFMYVSPWRRITE